MEDKRITAEEIQAELQADIKLLAEQMAEAINNARLGRIVDDSEEPVRDAHAVFRRRAFQKAIDLLGKRMAQEAFSPSTKRPQRPVEE
jgi:predicted nucleic acid-binding protein